MRTAAPLKNTSTKSALVSNSPHAGLLLQRKCDCGNSVVAGRECEECGKKELQRKFSIGASNDPLEQEADRVADQVLAVPAHAAVSGAAPHIQRFTGQSTGDAGTAPESVDQVLSGSGRQLDPALQQDMGQRFGHDFSQVRVHTGSTAEQSAREVNAHAYTVGQNIVFGSGRFSPELQEGRRILAHELTHVVQQSSGTTDMRIQRNVVEPARYRTVHENLFVSAPGGGSRLQWRDPSGADGGSAAEIKAVFRQHIEEQRSSLRLDETYIPPRTSEAQADTAAVSADARIRARFPMITAAMPEAQLRARVSRFGEERAGQDDFVQQWIENRLVSVTDIEEFDISSTDARYLQLISDIMHDDFIRRYSGMLAIRVAAFHEEDVQTGERSVFVNIGMPEELRLPTLLHELTHFYVHPIFLQWLQGTTNADFYGEGFTEYLARLIMTDAERDDNTNSYQDRWDAINTQVAQNVPDDDIARSYFAGEVWRVETRSTISRREAGVQLGLRESASVREERAVSQGSMGSVSIDMEYIFFETSRTDFNHVKEMKSRIGFLAVYSFKSRS